MPAQVAAAKTTFYSENDTYPPLAAQLLDGNNVPIDLTGATVTISIAYARYSYYYSPTKKIVDADNCAITDAVNGKISWTPSAGQLTPPGSYLYNFAITHAGGGIQTVPANTYLTMVVRAPVAGQGGAP